MTDHYIPFASFKTDWPLVNSLYADAAGSRITLQSLRNRGEAELPKTKLWIDAEVDGLHFAEVFGAPQKGFEKYAGYISQFQNARTILDSPTAPAVEVFVKSVLDAVMKAADGLANLRYISVPQLPYVPGSERNRLNRLLAEFSLKWKSSQRRPPRMILPVIFAKTSGQMDSKTERNAKVKVASSCFDASGADGIWIVDSKLNDHDSISSLENERFPGVIHFHEELGEKIPPDVVTIAGPYWGLNLALWARGVAHFPAIGVGRGYQYYIPGRDPQSSGAKPRVAVPPLKRLVVSTALKAWLPNALRKLQKADPIHSELAGLAKRLDYLTKSGARRQIAEFYRDWLAKLESASAGSRALTLYQDLSAAFVLGSRLEPFDRAVEDVPNPAIIAKQLMVNCL